MTKFIVNNTYQMKSPCDQACVWSYKVAKRTAKTVVLIDEDGNETRCRLRVYDDQEICNPLGRYSMAPTLRA